MIVVFIRSVMRESSFVLESQRMQTYAERKCESPINILPSFASAPGRQPHSVDEAKSLPGLLYARKSRVYKQVQLLSMSRVLL